MLKKYIIGVSSFLPILISTGKMKLAISLIYA